MSNMTDLHGSALLALTTRRPPDSNRGNTIIHFELALPYIIQTKIILWEQGSGPALDPREAAALLWSLPAAQYLNGEINGWLNVPGVNLLMPGLDALMTRDPKNWPNSQTELRALVASKAPGAPDWESLSHQLRDLDTLQLLNDLVLIFKFAAIGYRRPLRTIAELYRLAYTLLKSEGAPTSRDAVIAHLRAPLVSPRALTAPWEPTGPRSPPQNPHPLGSVGTLPEPIMEQLSSELTHIESQNRASRIRTALRGAGLNDDSFTPSVMSAISDVANVPPAVAGAQAPSIVPKLGAERAQPHFVRMQLFGAPVVIDIAEVHARIARQRRELATRIVKTLPATLRQRLQAAGVALEDLAIWPDLVSVISSSPSYLEPVGRNDLLLVRQTTTGYRRAEISYIENILIGETRNRDHANRILSRQEFFESTTRETEETRDLQVTDRAELSREISKVVNEDLKAQGSVEVTSRGPTKIVASANVSFEHSTEEAARSAEEYSRETVERAVKRTMERVTREARSLFEQEMTEVNKHGFLREGDAQDHVSGVYQYLERVSHARMLWYGERELYDILIPEPASMIWELATTSEQIQIPIDKPDEELFRSLTVDNIASKREEVIRAFRVTDMPPVPEDELESPMSFAATGSGDSAKHATSKELQIPDGYVVTSANFVASAEVEDADDKPNGGWTVADQVGLWEMSLSGNTGSTAQSFNFLDSPLAGPTVSAGMNADNFTSIVGNITLHLQLTEAGRVGWALDAYGRVAERYEQLRREYAQAVIQATANQLSSNVRLPEGARAQLNQVIRAEVQRASVDVMRNMPVNFDLIDKFNFSTDGKAGSHPVIDLTALRASEPEIRFLQQAFEWEHLSWILYPYFWGRRGEWSHVVVVSHPDPDFAAFLNAGAARVQIPVRPGFEDLVKHFMETGEVYEGDGLPKMGDPGYVPFIDEQMTSLGAPGEEVPWPIDNPRQWDFVSPTSLVLVRPAQAQLPSWDPDTGAENPDTGAENPDTGAKK